MPPPVLVEDARLAVIVEARRRTAALGVDAATLCVELAAHVRRGESVGCAGERECKGGTKRARALDDAGALVIVDGNGTRSVERRERERVYCEVIDGASPKRRRTVAPPECCVCLREESRRAFIDANHPCEAARGAVCVECWARLLSQRSPIACPLCRRPVDVGHLSGGTRSE